jgi:cytochrome P450
MKDSYLLADPKVVRSFLENSKHQEKANRPYQIFDIAVGGETFFAQNGHRAMHVRKQTVAAFNSQNIHKMAKTIDTILEKWITTRLEPLFVETNQPVDIDREMMYITAEVISEAGFEYELSREEKIAFVNDISFLLDVNVRRRSNPIKRTEWLGFLFPEIRQARRVSKSMLKVAKLMIRRNRERKEYPNIIVNTNTLASLISNDPHYASDDERARDILIFFFAGFDTTAHSIAWTFLELSRHQKEQEELRTALKNWIEKNEQKEDLRHCPAVKHATKEALRLHPPAPIGGYRILGEDFKLSEDWVLPKGSLCGIPIYSLLRNHNVFDKPNSFCPGRWENPSEESTKAFMPFLVGRRNCIGQALAKVELTGVVARLCSEYAFEVENEGYSHFSVTLQPKDSKLIFRRLSNVSDK